MSIQRMGSSIFVVAVIVSGTCQAAGTVSYGSRSGQDVTIVEMSGIDTTNAVVRVRHTRENAKMFCTEYLGRDNNDCIDQVIRETKISDAIRADCRTGQFVNLAGHLMKFAGANLDYDAGRYGAEYKIFSKGSKSPLDGSSASGFATNLDQFSVLCPTRFRKAEAAFTGRPRYIGRWYVNDKKVCGGNAGEEEGLLVYKSREFAAIETSCSIRNVQSKGPGRYELSMSCASEGFEENRRETVAVLNANKIERTVPDGKKQVKVAYDRCPF